MQPRGAWCSTRSIRAWRHRRREFTFLADTAARNRAGHGRRAASLEREPPRGYDVLGIDAFSGDSMPMHLLRARRWQLYVKHLKPDGVIVFQATNRFVDLLPVVKRLAAQFGLSAVHVSDRPRQRIKRLSLTGDRARTRSSSRSNAGAASGAGDRWVAVPLRPRARFRCGRTTSTTCSQMLKPDHAFASQQENAQSVLIQIVSGASEAAALLPADRDCPQGFHNLSTEIVDDLARSRRFVHCGHLFHFLVPRRITGSRRGCAARDGDAPACSVAPPRHHVL